MRSSHFPGLCREQYSLSTKSVRGGWDPTSTESGNYQNFEYLSKVRKKAKITQKPNLSSIYCRFDICQKQNQKNLKQVYLLNNISNLNTDTSNLFQVIVLGKQDLPLVYPLKQLATFIIYSVEHTFWAFSLFKEFKINQLLTPVESRPLLPQKEGPCPATAAHVPNAAPVLGQHFLRPKKQNT